ncbi:MAG: hypothetical protein JWM71_890 [Solirubrobacteraceae bacterium]|nr:hypothetical protein [Solirubrobacteraceae bacterium]
MSVRGLARRAAPPRLLSGQSRLDRLSTNSRRWHLKVNVIAASPWVHWRLRWKLLRRWGIDTEAAYVLPGCYFFSHQVTIGAKAWINHRCYFDSHAPITIGRDVDVGMEVMFCTSSHHPGPPGKRAGEYFGAPIVVGDGAWIGTRAVILPGITIGEGCVVAAGSVVSRDCEPHGLYAGVPARRIRDLPTDDQASSRA